MREIVAQALNPARRTTPAPRKTTTTKPSTAAQPRTTTKPDNGDLTSACAYNPGPPG
jgi:hypothetical protein